MSSLRNAIQRRNHKERSQPEERKKLGLLEKHKDYSARAKDYNKKKAHLASLRKLAAERNPDEFYHGMLSRSGGNLVIGQKKNATGTVHGVREGKELSVEAARLLKTQDLGYVRTMRNQVAKEVEELEEKRKGWGVGFDDDENSGVGKKTVFVDDGEELRRRVGEARRRRGSEMEVDSEDEDEEDEGPQLSKEERNRLKLQKKEQRKLEAKLEVARDRLKTLTEAEEALDLQRAKMGKSSSVGGVTKAGLKFKVRKRKG